MLRRTGYEEAAIAQFKQRRAELQRSPMRRMRNPRHLERAPGHPADRDDDSTPPQHFEEGKARGDLSAARRTVRARRSRVRRHDVPEQDVVRESELRECALDDRRSGLPRRFARQLTLRGERQARDARSSVPGGFSDEKDLRPRSGGEVARKPFAKEGCPRPFGVLVERVADAGRTQLGDECLRG